MTRRRVRGFELPTELAIDTDVARRVIAGFIRGQLRQAGFERAVLGAVGRHRFGARRVSRGRGDRRGAAALRADAVPDVVAGVARRRRGGRPPPRLQLGARRHHADGRRLLRPPTRTRPPLRRGNFMARQRMAVLYDRSVTWGGLVVGTGNKTESLIGYTTVFGDNACAFNPIGDLYKSQVRQLAAAIGVPDAIIRKAPSADLWPGQTDEAEAGLHLPGARSAAVLADRQAPLGRRDRGARLRAASSWTRVDRMVAGAEFKRQVPPIAKLGPRTAGVDYLYPRRRPGSARE